MVRLQGDLDRGSTEHPREDVLSIDMKEKMEQPRNGVSVAHEDTEQKCNRKSRRCIVCEWNKARGEVLWKEKVMIVHKSPQKSNDTLLHS